MTVIIGSKYTGKPKGLVNTDTGEYWEVLPPIEGGALELQKCLLSKQPPKRRFGFVMRKSAK